MLQIRVESIVNAKDRRHAAVVLGMSIPEGRAPIFVEPAANEFADNVEEFVREFVFEIFLVPVISLAKIGVDLGLERCGSGWIGHDFRPSPYWPALTLWVNCTHGRVSQITCTHGLKKLARTHCV